jgi:hypothetical protein
VFGYYLALYVLAHILTIMLYRYPEYFPQDGHSKEPRKRSRSNLREMPQPPDLKHHRTVTGVRLSVRLLVELRRK